jgi:hypothetical protein
MAPAPSLTDGSRRSDSPLARERISNREPLRLESHLTQTKQTPALRSNREKEACFSDRVWAVNRLCDCGEIESARRKDVQPTGRHDLKNSNREPLRLEIHLTQTKQTPTFRSNREIEAHFQPGEITVNSASPTRENAISSPRKLPRNSKNATTHPSFSFRLKHASILCFLRVTKHFNRTMFRLRRTSIEPIFRSSAAPKEVSTNRKLDSRPATRGRNKTLSYCNAQNLAVALL